MGVKDAIKDRMPLEWYIALRQHRVLTKFVNYVYTRFVPYEWRKKSAAKNMHRHSVSRIVHLFENTGFLTLFSPNDPDYSKWNEVYNTILENQQKWK